MGRIYSTYEAKAERTLASRIEEFRARGVLVPAGKSETGPTRAARKPGALERFLAERSD